MDYCGIIFDLDGTLLDTLDDLANSMNFVLKAHGFPIHDIEKYNYFIGNGLEKLVRRTLPQEELNEEMVKLCLSQLKDEYSKKWHEFTKPYDKIEELLNELSSKGIRMSVLSNKPDQFTKVMIDNFFGSERFDFVFGAREGIPNKPDPHSALEIAELSKIEPSKYLYLGDTSVDMNTARSAGMYAVGVTWGFRTADELLKNGAKLLIDGPMELMELIK